MTLPNDDFFQILVKNEGFKILKKKLVKNNDFFMAKNDDFFQNFSKIVKIINFAEILKKSSFFTKILKKSTFFNVIFIILNGLVRFFSNVVYCCLVLQH